MDGDTSRIGDGRFLVGSSLGGNQDDTIGSAHTVDGGRRGIFQYGYTLNVIGCEFRHLRDAALDTVDEHHGVVFRTASECSYATHADFRVVMSGLCTIGLQYHARQSSLEHGRGVGYRNVGHIVEVDGCHRSREVGFLLCTVTYDHHLFQRFGIFGQGDVECLPATEYHLSVQVAYVGND